MGLSLTAGAARLEESVWTRRLLGVLLAALLAAAAVGLAVVGLLVTTAPPWMGLPLEPLSLLLLPGYAMEQMTSGTYTFRQVGVLRWNGAVYFALFALLLLRRMRRGASG